MLFDIRGRRKRFIQVIYVFLALLLGGGLVLFGIGGDASGGLGDALGLGNSGSTGTAEFNEEVEAAEATLATDPENTEALLALARYNYLNGQQDLEVDEETGTQTLTDEATAAFEASVDAWERYLDANKGPIDDGVGALVFRAYTSIAFDSTNPAVVQRRLEGAQRTAEAVAEARPGPNSYLDLASSAYFAGDTKTGERAGEQALKALPEGDESSRTALEDQLKAAKRQGKLIQQQLKQQRKSGAGAEGPIGELGENPLAPPAETGETPPGG